MQLHELHSTNKGKDKKRIGRGGKRGTYSGRGSKGQKSRAGHRIRPGFRGGDNPVWKLLPKQRGASKKVAVKHSLFQVRSTKPVVVNFDILNDNFKDGDKITAKVLVKKGIVKTAKQGVKILGNGTLNRKLFFSNINVSKSAREKILKAGGSVE